MTTNVFQTQIKAKHYTYVHNEQGKVGRSIRMALADALLYVAEVDGIQEQEIDYIMIKKTGTVPVEISTTLPPTA